MKNLDIILQSFIIVGPTLFEIDSFYVSIDKVLYKVPSAIPILKVCFKSFYVLDAVYLQRMSICGYFCNEAC